ncbi:hypothetical protein A2971_02395 [Candidatus Gottesmanbacteria bacterium RIFCSPLOWO2_01_FULL_46_21]|uniref:Uncharacterized protein n=1 Tax=Candidatus Gottesmanbacteria bacterium RIFCSPLOWO2_01_FULL_46_21 TaxID=1798393 RepID=A0A1F6AYB5_9BACT|nr:MAG: hypothetical protein A2971_02395 [Candidatus Gottesmanbacteria bacterium RIFCSPLOWO2_01_FULL_46_21]
MKLAITINGTTIDNGIPNLPTDGSSALSVILSTGVGLILLVAVFASLAFIIWGGFDWITAGGNKENIQKARHKLIYAVLGLFIAFSAYFVMSIISQFFGIEFYELPFDGAVRHAPGTGPLE